MNLRIIEKLLLLVLCNLVTFSSYANNSFEKINIKYQNAMIPTFDSLNEKAISGRCYSKRDGNTPLAASLAIKFSSKTVNNPLEEKQIKILFTTMVEKSENYFDQLSYDDILNLYSIQNKKPKFLVIDIEKENIRATAHTVGFFDKEKSIGYNIFLNFRENNGTIYAEIVNEIVDGFGESGDNLNCYFFGNK